MNPEIAQFQKLLRKNNHYTTKARLRLFIALQKHSTLSTKELIRILPRHDKATIYRNIAVFEELGVLTRLQLGSNSKLELSDVFSHHHHHISCVRCGKVTSLSDNPKIESEITEIGKSSGYRLIDHQLEIRGLCPKCSRA